MSPTLLVTGASFMVGAAAGIALDRAIVAASGAWRHRRAGRAVVVVVSAVGFATLSAWWWSVLGGVSAGTAFEYLALLWLLAISIALVVIDARTHRLPDRIVLPSYPVAVVLFAATAVADARWPDLVRALMAGAVMFAFYLIVRVAAPGAMGGGDVKLAGVLGLYLGWSGWSTVLWGSFAAFVLGGVAAVVLLVSGRATRKTAIPFGPWMIAGAWIGLIAASVVWRT